MSPSPSAANGTAPTSRTDQLWTTDEGATVIVLSNDLAFLQMSFGEHHTTQAGVTQEFKSSAWLTALVHKEGSVCKLVASQNSGSGTQV